MSTSVDEACSPREAGPWRWLRGDGGQKGVALADQAIVSGASFVTTLVVGRVGGAEELGVYSLGFTLLVLALSFQDALVSSPYTVYSYRLESEDRARFAGSALTQLLI